MLTREHRLTKKSDFEEVRTNGKFFGGKLFSVAYLNKKNKDESRFGFIVAKKISTASVVRNRIKRVLREIIRKKFLGEKAGYDFVIIAKSAIIKKRSREIESELKKGFEEL